MDIADLVEQNEERLQELDREVEEANADEREAGEVIDEED